MKICRKCCKKYRVKVAGNHVNHLPEHCEVCGEVAELLVICKETKKRVKILMNQIT